MTKADSSPKPPAKLQTITLKAFIHCEGCRRKIRRIIRVLDDVEDVVVDSATGKVTITGTNLDLKTILQRLQKYGKQAEVWPAGGNAMPTNAAAKSAGGNQPKPAATSNGPSPNANSKKKTNAAGEAGGGAKPSSSEGNKGGAKEEESSAIDQKGKEAAASSEKVDKGKPEKSKESNADSKVASDANVPQHSGGGGNGNGGGGNGNGGGGKKGKKGGNGGPSDGSNSGGGGSNMLENPPYIAPDRPIASVPTTSVTVSANKGLAPYDYIQTGYSEYNSVEYATHMFSDENANNCSIM